jgi:DNA polymerase-3 subunit beta
MGIKSSVNGKIEIEGGRKLRIEVDISDIIKEIERKERKIFPICPDLKEENFEVEIPAELILKLIKDTLFAASNDKKEYILNAAFLEITEGKIKMTATDGYVLAHSSIDFESEKTGKWIIPKNILRVAREEIFLTRVYLSPNYILFQGDHFLVAKKREIDFPNYQKIIQESMSSWKMSCLVSKKEFLEAIKETAYGISEMIEGRMKEISVVKFSFPDNSLLIGEKKAEVLKTDKRGEEIKPICVAKKYLLESISTFKTNVWIRFTSPTSPILLEDDIEGEKKVIILMPMRI